MRYKYYLMKHSSLNFKKRLHIVSVFFKKNKNIDCHHCFRTFVKTFPHRNHNTNKDLVERTFHDENDISILYVAQWGDIHFWSIISSFLTKHIFLKWYSFFWEDENNWLSKLWFLKISEAHKYLFSWKWFISKKYLGGIDPLASIGLEDHSSDHVHPTLEYPCRNYFIPLWFILCECFIFSWW